MNPSSTVRVDEIERFNRLAATWWDRTGPMRPLHVVNELRLVYVLEQIAQRFARPVGALQGLRVADIGCGSGYLTERIVPRIGVRGTVLGVDIQQEMLDLLVKKMKAKGIENVKPILGAEADPKLDPASCDMMVMVDVYHEFEFPYEMMRKMVAALKTGGQIVFVEFRGEDPNVPIKLVHKMTEAQVKKEMAVHPEMEWVETKKELPQQHMIFFRRKP